MRNDKYCWVNIIVLVTLYHSLQLVLSKTIRIGNIEYQFSVVYGLVCPPPTW